MASTSIQTRLTSVRRRTSKHVRENITAYLFLSPWLIGLVVFTIGPILGSLYLSFTNFNLLQPPKWIGLSNYHQMFGSDPLFKTSLKITFLYLITSLPVKLIAALVVAMMLNRSLRAIGVYRAVYYLPSLIGTSVAVAYMWQQIFGANGMINSVLHLVGIQGTDWITNPSFALYTLGLLQAWQFGSSMIIFLAGLKQIPDSLYEAASIDGANKWGQFIKITIPLLSPVIFFNLIMQMIGSFTQFTQGFIITGGGPMNATLFYALYLYQQAFSYFRMGYASAMAWFLLIIIAVVTGIIFKTSKYWLFYQSEGGAN